jgi:NADH-quinone oxidoreductase subunit L
MKSTTLYSCARSIGFQKNFDAGIIDGAVNGIAKLFAGLAAVLRRWQTGVVQNYAVTMVVGLIIILGYLLMG